MMRAKAVNSGTIATCSIITHCALGTSKLRPMIVKIALTRACSTFVKVPHIKKTKYAALATKTAPPSLMAMRLLLKIVMMAAKKTKPRGGLLSQTTVYGKCPWDRCWPASMKMLSSGSIMSIKNHGNRITIENANNPVSMIKCCCHFAVIYLSSKMGGGRYFCPLCEEKQRWFIRKLGNLEAAADDRFCLTPRGTRAGSRTEV